mgnify:CR=1 FL=1
MSKEVILKLSNVSRVFKDNTQYLKILENVNLEIRRGEKVAIVGRSGSGKSTLLYIMGLLDKPTAGQVVLHSRNIAQVDDKTRSQIRNHSLGFVYQFHYLLSEFTALENVMMPAIIGHNADYDHMKRAKYLLKRLDVLHRAHHYPSQLSGGEQQRVAIARALLNKPEILFADEPTGNLDDETSKGVYQLFEDIIAEEETTLVLVTHNKDLAHKCDRTLTISQRRCTS